MSFWLWLFAGLVVGVAPTWLAGSRLRPWWARHWCQLAVALAVILIVLPWGIVLLLFLIDPAWEAIAEMGALWTGDFRDWAGVALGWLAGSGAMAWRYRGRPNLPGPPLSASVQELARDPDRLAAAVQTYRRETGADLPAALDVIEQFGLSGEGAAQPRPAGALEWMYVGFGAAWYVAFAGAYVLTFSSQGNPILAALGFFVFLPALFSGFCGVCHGTVTTRFRAALSEGWQRGTLTRPHALFAGAAAEVLSIALVALASFLLSSLHDFEAQVWLGLICRGTTLSGAPFFGLWLLRRRLG
jgi:hypothetical protein